MNGDPLLNKISLQDRNNIAAAKLAGLQTELKLTSVQYTVSTLLTSDFSKTNLEAKTTFLEDRLETITYPNF